MRKGEKERERGREIVRVSETVTGCVKERQGEISA